MAKRYLSIEEAAERLGLRKDEVNRLRTKGEIRGFADRGTFKFKEEDVEELARRLQPSSDPEVPMIDGEDDGSVLDDEPATDDDDAPSIIRRLSAGGGGEEDAVGSIFDDFGKVDSGSSDSDVRLVMDDRLNPQHDSGPDVLLQLSESDSDVCLADDNASPQHLSDSDSDVRLSTDGSRSADSGLNLSESDSDSDVCLSSDSGGGSQLSLGDSDSDVRLSLDGPLAADSALKLSQGESDSDVRLDDSGLRAFAPPDSDSDVQLAPSAVAGGPKPDSDSDVMLIGPDDSDSDVHLAGDDEDSGLTIGSKSDSDVQLIAEESDSDVRLLDPLAGPKSSISKSSKIKSKVKPDSDSDVAVLSDDSGLALDIGGGSRKSGLRGAGSSVLLEDESSSGEDSGISLGKDSGLALGDHSGIGLDRAADSGLSLEKMDEQDSGLALFSDDEDEAEDDGITLAEDSGIALQVGEDDSGIALIGEEDSGIALHSDEDSGLSMQGGEDSGISMAGDEDEGLTLGDTMTDSGIALKDDDNLDLTETIPTVKLPKGRGKKKDADGLGDTMLEVPTADFPVPEESDFEIGSADSGSVADTSVLLFDDEDETDDGGAAMVKKKPVEDEEEEEAFEFAEGESDEDAAVGEDIEGDVFAGDEAFEEESEFGESEGELEAVTSSKTVVGTVEYPWGGVTVGFLAASSVCMLFCGMASIDLVRSMWGWQAYSPANGWLIETLGGLFK